MCKVAFIVISALLASSSLAFAQNTGGVAADLKNRTGAAAVNGPVIGGAFDSKVRAGNITTKATGTDSTARSVLGSMTDGAANSFRSDVDVKDVETIADGERACAEAIIGSVGTSGCVKR